VKRRAAERSACLCERHLWRAGEVCRRPAKHFDHLAADGLGGDPVLDNCAHLCIKCHNEKTQTEDTPRMRKADAQRKHVVLGVKPAGPKLRSRGFPASGKPRKPKLPLPTPKPLYE
jgi:hypothetical protein